ncbi:MAG TPA: V-type ATPase subunit, partial [Coriobacteriia bacterium]|nr:V-type ATPase subunit [Coriobacteriia bacterium]
MLIVEEARLTRDSLRYGFAVGKVKVLETRTLDASAYERLLDAPSFAEQKRLLSETPYGRYLEDAETPDDVEHALDEALENFYGFLKAAALPEPVMRFF